MFSPPRKLKIIVLLCGVLFAAGMTQLFLLRFEAGNIYPSYSSLRSDPLGTRALFESLERLPDNKAGRNYRPWRQINFDTETTFIVVGLGTRSPNLEQQNIEKLLDGLAQNGGRLVMAFSAGSQPRKKDSPESESWTEPGSESGDKKDDCCENDKETVETDPIEEFVEEEADGDDPSKDNNNQLDAEYGLDTLGVQIHSVDDDLMDDAGFRMVDRPAFLPLEIPWRSHLYFETSELSWETLYTWQDEPVVVQRSWGQGRVVLLADSYLFSNEALRNHRASGLLAWLVVPGHNILFDEFHKGLAKQPGVAGLTRKYRLHWVFAALLVVTGLFIWRQAAVFVPSVQAERGAIDAPPAVGRDTNQGMVDLSRQHIGTKELLTVCFQSWKSQAAQRVSPSQVDEVKTMVGQAATDPRKEIQVQTYKQICELLKQGKRS